MDTIADYIKKLLQDSPRAGGIMLVVLILALLALVAVQLLPFLILILIAVIAYMHISSRK